MAEKKPGPSWKLLLVILGVLVVFAWATSDDNTSMSEPADESRPEVQMRTVTGNVARGNVSGERRSGWDARALCNRAIWWRLGSPAETNWPARFLDTHLGDGVYQASSYVDWQNSSGAWVRTNFTCRVDIPNERVLSLDY